MAEHRKAQPPLATQDPGDPFAEVEAMILRLTELRQREPGRTLGRAVMPARVPKPTTPAATAPEPRAKPPQAALPLGPVVVRARKPRPR